MDRKERTLRRLDSIKKKGREMLGIQCLKDQYDVCHTVMGWMPLERMKKEEEDIWICIPLLFMLNLCLFFFCLKSSVIILKLKFMFLWIRWSAEKMRWKKIGYLLLQITATKSFGQVPGFQPATSVSTNFQSPQTLSDEEVEKNKNQKLSPKLAGSFQANF